MTDVWTIQSREDEIEYCKQHGIDLPFSADSSYSRDRNLWHISHEGLELEDPSLEPNFDHLLVLSVSPEKAPDQGEYVTMTFEKGVPTLSLIHISSSFPGHTGHFLSEVHMTYPPRPFH